MAEDGEKLSVSIDNKVDSNIETPPAPKEKYKGGIAVEHTHSAGNSGKLQRSWTMDQVDRIISTEILPSRTKKLAIFGLGLQRKNNFRLSNLTSRLSTDIRNDFIKEVQTGPISRRIREFDISSQSMRTISANAALGSFQFQKTYTLPFMRKSLSLGYQKVDLLKRVVGSIQSLEKTTLSKLEAIKLNTGAASNKGGFLKRLREQMRTETIRRISSNFTDVAFHGYDKQYKRFVSPLTQRIHDVMSDPSKKGGVNGVIGSVTKTLNNIRHRVKDVADSDEHKSPLSTIKKAAARVATGGLNAAVSLGQKVKLSDPINRSISSKLTDFTYGLSKLEPFQSTPIDFRDDPESYIAQKAREFDGVSEFNSSQPKSLMGELLSEVDSWRLESRKTSASILAHLETIRKYASNLTNLSNKDGGTNLLDKYSDAPSKPQKDTPKRSNRKISKPDTPKVDVPKKELPKPGDILDKLREFKVRKPTPVKTEGGGLTDKFHSMANGLYDRIKGAASDRGIDLEVRGRKLKDNVRSIKSAITKEAKITKQVQLPPKKKLPKVPQKKIAAPKVKVKAPVKPPRSVTGRVARATGRAGLWTAKKTARGGIKTAKFVATKVPKGIYQGAKLAGRGAWAASELAGSAVSGLVGSVGGSLLRGGLGVAGKGIGGLGSLAKGAGGLLKGGLGAAAGVGLAGTGVKYLSNKYLTGTSKRVGTTAGSMLQYGAMGATIGSIIPGVGTVIGGAVGAAVGAIVENTDLIAEGMSKVGKGISTVGSWIPKIAPALTMGILGPVGLLINDKKTRESVLDGVKGVFFGADAKYSKDGKLISPAKKSLMGEINDKFQLMLYGIEGKDGKRDASTSLMGIITKKVSSIADSIKTGASSLGSGISSAVGANVDMISSIGGSMMDSISGYTGVSGNEASKTAFNFFVSKGWTRAQAAGIVGNLQVESGNFSPKVLSGQQRGDGGKAVGVAQWHPDRQAKFARQFNKSIIGSSLLDQLAFVDWELRNDEKGAGTALARTTDPATAAAIVDEKYERSSGEHRRQRMANAVAVFKSGPVGVSVPTQPTPVIPTGGVSKPPQAGGKVDIGAVRAASGGKAPELFRRGPTSSAPMSTPSTSTSSPASTSADVFGAWATLRNKPPAPTSTPPKVAVSSPKISVPTTPTPAVTRRIGTIAPVTVTPSVPTPTRSITPVAYVPPVVTPTRQATSDGMNSNKSISELITALVKNATAVENNTNALTNSQSRTDSAKTMVSTEPTPPTSSVSIVPITTTPVQNPVDQITMSMRKLFVQTGLQ